MSTVYSNTASLMVSCDNHMGSSTAPKPDVLPQSSLAAIAPASDFLSHFVAALLLPPGPGLFGAHPVIVRLVASAANASALRSPGPSLLALPFPSEF